MRVRVVTYNVQSFRAGVGTVAAILGPEEPDVVLLQECGSRRELRRFAETLDMAAESSHRPFGRVRNAVLARQPWRITGVEAVRLPRQGRSAPRGYLWARLRRTGVPLTVVSAHLGLSERERLEHVRQLGDRLAGVEEPAILGIDLNEGPDAPAAAWMRSRLFDVFAQAGRGAGETFPARVPEARIDFLFATEAARPERAWVSADPGVVTASDHRPVLADLELEGMWAET